jgi:hypothetical protein
MRMWGVRPIILCNKHLLGEHVEMHMFVGTLNKGISIQGYIDKGEVIPERIVDRHNKLVAEMILRGMNHKSPLELSTTKLARWEGKGKLDIPGNMKDLAARCPECRKRQKDYPTQIYTSPEKK